MAMESDHGMPYGQPHENSRIPRVEDFPPVVQREIQARNGQQPPHHEEDRGPLGLLKRLAQVGLGRQEKADAAPRQPKAAQRAPAAQRRQAAPQPQQPLQAVPGGHPLAAPHPQQPAYGAAPVLRQAAPASEYAPQQWQPASRPAQNDGLYRPRQGDLDPHGRAIPAAKSLEDGELEIPAFLRRQAN
jgi:cell division protein FtsZ